MSEASRLAPHLAGPAWIQAREQTEARGRRGREWRMPPGNFAATLVFRPQGGPAEVARFSFVAALALNQTLARLSGPHARLAIKWPNDVLLNGGKVAGILLESHGAGQGAAQLLVGFGVNLTTAPDPGTLEPGAVAPVAVLPETGVAIAPQDFLAPLADAFARWQAQYETFGFAPVRTAWLARAARLGERITARTGSDSRSGIFEGIDENGALLLQTPEGRASIAAADIFF